MSVREVGEVLVFMHAKSDLACVDNVGVGATGVTARRSPGARTEEIPLSRKSSAT